MTGQLGERIPTAVAAMSRAAKDIGLTMNGTEAELFKMMEQGKVMAKDIMPAFAKQLRATAHEGNALAHALETNLAVALGRAQFNVQQLSNSIFEGGLATATKTILDGFSELAPRIKDLAYLLGTTLGSAILTVTAPFTLLGAIAADIWKLFKDITGVSDDMDQSMLKVAATVVGVLIGLRALVSVGKMLTSVFKGASAAMGGFKTAVGGVTGGTAAKTGAARGLSMLNPYLAIGTAGAAVTANAGQGGALSASNLFGENSLTSFLDRPISSFFSSDEPAQKPKLQIEVTPRVDSTGSLNAFIDSKLSAQEMELINSFQTDAY